MIKTLILATVLLVGAPWAKNIDKIEPPDMELTEAVTVSSEAEVFGNSEQVTEDEWTHSAVCTITHYCHGACCNGARWAYQPTASGAWPEAGRTVAVDPSVIPLGSEVLVNGHIYVAEDTGVKGYWVDIFCASHSEALNRGMFTTEVSWR